MNTAISTLEIPQGATELTLNELKLICGGDGEDDGCYRRPRRLKLEKVIETKIKTKVYKVRRPCDGYDDGDE